MRGRQLTVLQTPDVQPQKTDAAGRPAPLGVLSVHFEGGRCRVRCPFCYLGQRSGTDEADSEMAELDLALVEDALLRLDYRELAVTLSEPSSSSFLQGQGPGQRPGEVPEPVLAALARFVQAATARGRLAAVTTTLAVARQLPAVALFGIGRLNLSVDPWKGPCQAIDIASTLAEIRAKWSAERVLIVTLSTQRFAEELQTGLLGELLALHDVDRIALNALKPPPAWCDRAFWLQALARLRPLLRQHLDRRLFLDCYVAARLLGIGDCPARPDISPNSGPNSGSTSGPASRPGVAFRSCVYQPAPDFIADSGAELAAKLAGFVVPAICPFPIR